MVNDIHCHVSNEENPSHFKGVNRKAVIITYVEHDMYLVITLKSKVIIIYM